MCIGSVSQMLNVVRGQLGCIGSVRQVLNGGEGTVLCVLVS